MNIKTGMFRLAPGSCGPIGESGSMSFVALWFLTYVQTCIFALFVHIHNYTYVYAYTFMYIHNVQYMITHLSYIYVYIHMFII